MDDKAWASLGLVACGLVWAGMAAGPVRCQRWQAWALALWRTLLQRLRNPTQARQARREAAEAIERARRAKPKVDREGNVYRPDTFNAKRDGRDKLH
ncbi:MAG: hypothetical protein Q7U73_19180 [Rubrivivax sp.]|nr:hypothetical protein [Rubrivivax sp.]